MGVMAHNVCEGHPIAGAPATLTTPCAALPSALRFGAPQAITLVRGQTGDSRVAFRRAVEVRSRVDPPLAPGFFGNATVGVPEENLWATAGDLLR